MKLKHTIKYLAVLVFLLPIYNLTFAQGVVDGEKNADGSIKKWHRIEVALDGPNLAEEPDTFRNYRLDVTFISPSNQRFEVAGFFDGDGEPANTSANSGDKWKARFTTGEEGQWRYNVSFVTGTDVAANITGGNGGTAPDGQSGTFRVGPQDKFGKDFRAKGKLEYVDEHYLQFGNGENFVKVGTNSPEVFIADQDIDGTPANRDVDHSFQENEFRPGDPTWGNNRGRGIIGVVNYLSNLGVNSHYFLTMNIEGDGTASFPFIDRTSPYTYDVSKLAQWEIVFSHFDTMGLMLHFQTTETENRNYFENLEGGRNATEFAVARRIYYRELAARFGHHLAITWGVGEENNANFGSGQGNSLSQRLAFAERISDLTPYNDHIVIHNGGANRNAAVDLFTPLLGQNDYTGTSLQLVFDEEQHDFIKFWYDESVRAGKKWVISYDETFPPMSRIDTRDLEQLRAPTLWSTLLAGGHLEWYHGFQNENGDTNRSRDYSTLEAQYEVLGIAANFMNDNFSADIHTMIPNDALINGNLNYAMANQGNVYLFYLRNGGNATVDLSAGNGRVFTVKWFNTRTGQTIDRANVNGGSAATNLGNPPSQTGQDWAIVLRRDVATTPVNQEPVVSFNTPGNGTDLTAPATLSVDVSASDSDGSVAFVELFLDNVLVRQDSNSPFRFNDNNQDQVLSGLPTGSYSLRAVATDNDGAAAAAVRVFTVSDQPANQAPSVSFSRPANNVNLTSPGSVVVEASASDLDGSVASVELSINGVTVRTLRAAPYIWNGSNQDVQLSGLVTGSYILSAVATDNDGATSTAQRAITVTNPTVGNTPPVVSFTQPANNTNLDAPATLIVDVAASDADGSVRNVQLLLNGVNIRTERVNPYKWNDRNQDAALASLAEGTYTLTAIATDNEGATSSEERTFTVGNNEPEPEPEDATTPVVSFSLPLSGGILTAPATIIANVDATVEQGRIATVELYVNGEFLRRERVVPYVWNSRNGGSLDPSLSNLAAGTYELRAVATSSSGEQTEATTTITVTPN